VPVPVAQGSSVFLPAIKREQTHNCDLSHLPQICIHRKMPYQVHKFGGTSVANSDCFRQVADIVKNVKGNCMVVVSAMGGKPKTTDLLLNAVAAAAQRNTEEVERLLQLVWEKHETCIGDLLGSDHALLATIRSDLRNIRDILKTVSLMKWQATRIAELVAGHGETWSAQVLAQHLGYTYLDARQVIVVQEDDNNNFTVEWKESQRRLNAILPTSSHFCMTGYICVNTEGVATTLQRDGSDYSAAIVGRLLQAESVSIWTDVDGVLSADPRRVPLAQVLQEVSYKEAMELAYFGAKVIHPKTMQPLVNPPIPLYIRNTFNAAAPGTRIFTTSSSSTHRDQVVCGFTSIDGMALINVEGTGMLGVRGNNRRLFSALEADNINVVLVSQASSEHSITLAIQASDVAQAETAIHQEFRHELHTHRITAVDIRQPCSIIAAVGDGMSHTTGVSGLFFSALGDAKINILAIAQGSSERNISAVVQTADSSRALRAVHAAFRLSHVSVRVAVVGVSLELGQSLLQLLEEKRAHLRQTFELDLQVVAVLPTSESESIWCLEKDVDGGSDSITIESLQEKSQGDKAVQEAGGLDVLLSRLVRNECTNHVIFDCTNDEAAGKFHAAWLRAGVDVVTANNTGLSGPKEQRDAISRAEKALGKQSAKYLREVTVGGGLPIINTARTLLETGDKIRRIDGILSVSLSFIMFRISPPSNIKQCSEYDEASSNGAFRGDMLAPNSDIGETCSFSQAVQEATALGLMEDDPTKDMNNEYTARVLMILARELGVHNFETIDIQNQSDSLLLEDESILNITLEMDTRIATRVSGAKSRGCVLRQVCSVDIAQGTVAIKLQEIPDQHIFAVTPPSCECVRFFTHRHMKYPLIVQGPSAGAASTASALLADLLSLMRGKAAPRATALSRAGSSAALKADR